MWTLFHFNSSSPNLEAVVSIMLKNPTSTSPENSSFMCIEPATLVTPPTNVISPINERSTSNWNSPMSDESLPVPYVLFTVIVKDVSLL
mmetsp:Transcript_9880/g.10955  ORF Transcript_9880/g.10955 Transcript_9880/m.10955 type:complete len:89 (-) Transcript_9880:440-706(-)